ncbi:MAG: chromosomal replication initiator protein DnaA [Deltaproteobacteria bacterium]|nr:chromosomal replication initiator protein DnaA [Deltaproteobacteria bacterium]MBW2136248.1 chromosomal replication initiator protein DnaA [Deltaproteobacteria bacterium]
MTTIWELVKEQMKDELPEHSFAMWIAPLRYLEEREDTLVLGCPNKFSLNWISENYRALMEEKLDKVGDKSRRISLKTSAPRRENTPLPFLETPQQLRLPRIEGPSSHQKRCLNDQFTFDRFVVGKSNEFAYSVSRAITQDGTWPYSHIFLVANTGLGKSHLSQAIGNAILDGDPKVRVLYLTAEDFINQMIFALKGNRIEEFKNKFRRSCDVLLLEEVHFLSGKEKTQAELEHTLDALANDNKKLIFTSSLLPKHIPHLKKGLSSRLTSGIITRIEPPDYHTRLRIIERKSGEEGLSLRSDVIEMLAKCLEGDIRQIESALKCLKAKSELLKERINKDLARDILQCHAPLKKTITVEDIQALICKYFKVDPIMLRSKSRKKLHSYPRNIYVYLCRLFTDSTVQDIGDTINRNHSTVLYSSEVIEHMIKKDAKVRNHVDFLKQKLRDMTR